MLLQSIIFSFFLFRGLVFLVNVFVVIIWKIVLKQYTLLAIKYFVSNI